MSRSRLVPLLRDVLPAFPGFAAKGRLLFKSPIDQMLAGIILEPSAFDRVSFTVETFVMPLCVPSNHIYFLFCQSIPRPPKGYGWSSDAPDVAAQLVSQLNKLALPYLSSRRSLPEFIETIPHSHNWHHLQARGYGLARVGRMAEAVAVLDVLLAKGTAERAWELALVEQASKLRAMLIQDPFEARQQLIAWEAETVGSLGLMKFRLPA